MFYPFQSDALPVQTSHIQAITCDGDRSNKGDSSMSAGEYNCKLAPALAQDVF